MAFSQIASALLLGLATAVAPESPYWLVERGRSVPAAQILTTILVFWGAWPASGDLIS